MATTTKRELVERIADKHGLDRCQCREVIQLFLDGLIEELGQGNRLEFRDFGVFECVVRKARVSQNPRTLEKVPVPEHVVVRFRAGRIMKEKLGKDSNAQEDRNAGTG